MEEIFTVGDSTVQDLIDNIDINYVKYSITRFIWIQFTSKRYKVKNNDFFFLCDSSISLLSPFILLVVVLVVLVVLSFRFISFHFGKLARLLSSFNLYLFR